MKKSSLNKETESDIMHLAVEWIYMSKLQFYFLITNNRYVREGFKLFKKLHSF
jgi:hypothetical protein